MKKKGILIIISLLVVMSLALGSFSCGASETETPVTPEEPIEINLNLIIPPTINRAKEVVVPWTELIEQETGGRVEFIVHYAGALATSAESHDALLAGLFEMDETGFSHTPGRAPYLDMLNQIPNIGGLPPLASAYTKAYWNVHKKFPEVQADWGNVKLFANFPVPLFVPLFRTPLKTLEDIKGLKVEDNGHTPAVEALGMIPVSVPTSGEIYLAVQSGMVDGAMESPVTLIAFKLGEHLKFMIDNFSVGCTYLGLKMNMDVWNSLPKDIQAVFEKNSGDVLVNKYADFVDVDMFAMIDLAKKTQGVTVWSLPPDELARWLAATDHVKDDVLAKLESQGATKVKEVYLEYEEFAKTLK